MSALSEPLVLADPEPDREPTLRMGAFWECSVDHGAFVSTADQADAQPSGTVRSKRRVTGASAMIDPSDDAPSGVARQAT